MKKIICFCAACFLVASLTTSCNKKCVCTTYVDGVEVISGSEFDVESGKKCKDYNSEVTILGKTTSVKCKTQIN